ncbi:MAG: glycerol-3-phosphate dehydrogenase/oxidase [Actinomycetales bacterium]|nr:glycerol-3-phosphate dehydrogenase/oxidase [Actinomycetales bacterium]
MTQRPPHALDAARPEVAAIAAAERTSVVVIGGGINGIATFRDLALQGVDVVLVERADFASGASSASSHMIHGGIRYLEYGEFRLVRESVRERNDLLRTAPHIVHPLETTIPIYSLFSGLLSAPLRFLLHRSGKPKERGALLIKVGLVFYDLFSRGGRVVPKHRFSGRRRTLEALPDLDPAVKYSATYYDAGMADPERLALDVLLDGVAAHAGAHAANYVEAIGLTPSGVRLRDRETGAEFEIAAEVVVNATGPWVDLTGAELGEPSEFGGGTKGSHIVLDHPELLAATRGREIFFEYDDGRIVLVYPIRDRVLIGTTDLEADPAEPVVCTEEEVDYFLSLVHSVFPAIPVDRSQIVYRFSGIRPLPRHDGEAAGSVSRDYRIEQAPSSSRRPALLTLIGGKWTTFRALGETLGARVLAVLGRERTASTRGLPIGGGRDFPRDADARRAWIDRHLGGVAAPRREILFARYGTRAAEVVRALGDGPEQLIADGLLSTAEVAYLALHERVAHLEDLVLRRTDLAFTGRCTPGTLDQLGAALASALDWDLERLGREIADCGEVLRRHGVPAAEGAGRA